MERNCLQQLLEGGRIAALYLILQALCFGCALSRMRLQLVNAAVHNSWSVMQREDDCSRLNLPF